MQNAGGDHQVLCAKGAPALSNFKLIQLQTSIDESADLSLQSLQSRFCYFLSTEISSELQNQIDEILDLVNAELVQKSALFFESSILVLPRLGTTSPWSTKATEILHRCGFVGIDRIERGVVWNFQTDEALSDSQRHQFELLLMDRMTESVIFNADQIPLIFKHSSRKQTTTINVMTDGVEALRLANRKMGLALSELELEYLNHWCVKEGRNPTETELMMFSQVNSEHCRHKIFNSSWNFDGVEHRESMFSMIRETHRHSPGGTLVAYKDNAAVIEGRMAKPFAPTGTDREYQYLPEEPAHIVFKAETHNHPTAISPFPGAATGAGGEIRDEGATGIGGKPKAGICGFSVSHLRIPGYRLIWESSECRPSRIASPLQIMLEGPIGAASFNNEFGRPNIGGYFRTFEMAGSDSRTRYGYHKPIMFAGGIGNIRPHHIEKKELNAGDVLVVIGGPAMLIGLGGGAASSLGQGSSDEGLDFASVQRSNPEMQRRCQEIIDRCREFGDSNPILSIHDVGAGGLSNAVPEIVHAAGRGAEISLHDIPVDDVGMSAMEIWCNESQERYVLAIKSSELDRFSEICRRENCPWQVIGEVLSSDRFLLRGGEAESSPVNVSLDFLLGDIQQPIRKDVIKRRLDLPSEPNISNFEDCVERTLRFPAVADKTFLITIGDRTVSGLVHRDQMVGPWQVPVADASVTIAGYQTYSGEVMSVGERSPIAIIDEAASTRMAVGEALTNLRSAGVVSLSDVKICANWMASVGIEGECSSLYTAVQSVALEFCVNLGLSIPVGKDSLSMMTEWVESDGENYQVYSPVSLVASAFAPLHDVRKTLTPQLSKINHSKLFLVDLGAGKNRMGMSVLYQSFEYIGAAVPDVDDVSLLAGCFHAIGDLIDQNLLLAYHDRSDGGLLATLCEMAFAGRVGLDIDINDCDDPIQYFFNEELGVVLQIKSENESHLVETFRQYGVDSLVHLIGTVADDDNVRISVAGELIFSEARINLHRIWSELTNQMQSRRDNPDEAQQEYDRILDVSDPGLSFSDFSMESILKDSLQVGLQKYPSINSGKDPKIAVLREQGVNGHLEMAAAFDRAGFESVDIVMVDLLDGVRTLSEYSGIVLCGGFSFGDVFGAGRGWASLILKQNQLRDMFEAFFSDTSKFALGVCNGCQVMAELKQIVPGASDWPKFVRNRSEQFEARLVMNGITSGKSVFTQDLQGLAFPVAVAHGEGRAQFQNEIAFRKSVENRNVCFQYVDNRKEPTQVYPYNPNGSYGATAGVTNSDGRVTAMMPHPERVFRMAQYSWAPEIEGDESPWMMFFRNARRWLS